MRARLRFLGCVTINDLSVPFLFVFLYTENTEKSQCKPAECRKLTCADIYEKQTTTLLKEGIPTGISKKGTDQFGVLLGRRWRYQSQRGRKPSSRMIDWGMARERKTPPSFPL